VGIWCGGVCLGMDISDEDLRQRKDKKKSKYFDVLINDKKVRVLAYHVKNDGKTIEFSSQKKLDKADRGEVIIVINADLKFKGIWKFEYHSPGNYGTTYEVLEKM
jgi:hypothetical protein